jgi:ATP-dependent DNA helicase RecG
LPISTQENIVETSVMFLKGVGPQKAEMLAQELGIFTYGDLLNHFPYRYFDRTQLLSIGSITDQQEYVQCVGTIINLGEEGDFKKRRLTGTVYDDTGRIDLVWFQGINAIKKNIREGGKYIVFGKVNSFNGYLSIMHPEVEALSAENSIPGMQPVYSTTERLRIRGITNRSFSKITQSLFEKLSPNDVPEILPTYILTEQQLYSRFDGYRGIHFPANELDAQQGRYRLLWEELFVSQLKIGRLRLQHQLQKGWVFGSVGQHFNNFYSTHLPFPLTGAQKRVIKEIRHDVGTGVQMNRLLQGDVGSGKTIVALLVMLLALDNGHQACIMAPTEILARQHYMGIAQLLEGTGIEIRLLTGSVKGKERKAVLQGLSDGTLPLVAGTHALLEETVAFKSLGLAVIDEQHRFGVEQRARLWKKNELPPHILVMTATPIPRTLAMTSYGDLEISVIDELPPGRREIKTVHRKELARAKVMEFLRSEVDKGRQVCIVYPIIEESEKLDLESLIAGYEQVKIWFNPDRYHIAMVHGKQDPAERERNMARFVRGEAHVLVATTVIEVGVNVPNATVMLIESAERFGLSQMHQLRGRVGRGAEQSYCILLTSNKLSDESCRRIKIMTDTTDGFKIAEEDLAMRGPGDIHGTRQSGELDFKLADIVKDKATLELTRLAAQKVLTEDPELKLPKHAALRAILSHKKNQVHWSKIS